MDKLIEHYRSLSVQAKASFWFLISGFIQKGISFISTPLFIRLMSTEQFGQFGVFNSWLGIISVFVTLNLYLGVYSQGLVKFSKERPLFISSVTGLISLLTLGYTALYIAFHNFFNSLFHLSTSQMMMMLLISWTTAIFSLWAEEQRVLYKYKALVVLSISMCIIKPLLGILLVINSEDKVTARIISLVLFDIIVCTVLFIRQTKKCSTLFSKKYWIYALKFNLPLLPHYLSATVLNSADRIMIEDMTNSANAGIYNFAYAIAIIMGVFGGALMQTISPWIYTKIKENKIQDIGEKMYPTLLIVGAVNILMILFAPDIIHIIATSDYYEAIWTIPPVAMSVYFSYCYDLFAKFAFYHEKTLFIMIASMIGAALNILLNYLMIPEFGYIAAGYTTLVCYMVFAAVHYLFMRRVCREKCGGVMPYRTRTLIVITTIFFILGILLTLTYYNALLRYGVLTVIIIVCICLRKRIIKAVSDVMALKKKAV